MSRRNINILLFITAVVLTGAYLLGIATNVAPWLRGPQEWRWSYVVPATFARLWLPVIVTAAYLLFILWWDRRPLTRNQKILALLLAAIMTPVLQLSLLYLNHADVRAELFLRTISEISGGFFNVGAVVSDNGDFLANFAAHMASFPIHPERHPPGLPLLFANTRQFFDQTPFLAETISDVLRPYQCYDLDLMAQPNSVIASAIIQMVIPFALALVAWALYFWGRREYDEKTALRAALLWPLLPSVALWATRWNQLYALFTVLAFLFLHIGLQRRRAGVLFLSGLIVSFGAIFSFGNLVIAGFLGMYALLWFFVQSERPSIRWVITSAILFFMGLSTLWFVAWVFVGLNLYDIWQKAMTTHLGLGRSYLTWLFYHPYDFFVFLGISLFIFWCAQVIRAARDLRSQRYDILTLSFAAALFLLVVSGTSQGEVARVWAFLFPLALLIAVRRIPRHGLIFSGLAALLAIQILVSNAFLQTVRTHLRDAPAPPPIAVLEAGEPIAVWEDGMILERITLPETAVSGQAIPIDVIWNSDQQSNHPYWYFFHLLDEEGNLVTQRDGIPLYWEWPTTCWREGQPIADSIELYAVDDLRPGSYQLQMGFYWPPSDERIPLIVPEGRIDNILEAGTIEVENGG